MNLLRNKENLCISEPIQFKPRWLKGQLYIHFKERGKFYLHLFYLFLLTFKTILSKCPKKKGEKFSFTSIRDNLNLFNLYLTFAIVQLLSCVQLCSVASFPVLRDLPEFTQTHVH